MMDTREDKEKKRVWEKPLVQSISLKLTRSGDNVDAPEVTDYTPPGS